MAADSREDTAASQPPSGHPADQAAASTHDQKVYETFNLPPESANILPGGSVNTAGGTSPEAGFMEAAKTIQISDFQNVHKQPCVRDSLLTGIASGFGLGGVRAVLGAPLPKASNWAVGTFCVMSFAAYEYCQIKRHMELEGMKRAVEIIDKKKVDREQKMEEARLARRKAKEEADQQAEEHAKSKGGWGSWKGW
ncbi:hypothetical protein L228DRAFT_237483 [Xylona heveae TC161]|uniref:Cytochrome c oxidase assembly protein COX20, mitochondrial n=1 Tax=Xylona heveae (strain CBS 132557 / TC161) TaxID=1328760 RepID=A0A161TQF9_XYLHT|nr:hypothetical protein L228DRAFT_237483 [Xylona heveae TC161]KZF24566.1 hypothetical protein L228DRAFT_237483 [Xylona heveae TC161]